jgi:hypothetical protein
MGLRGLVHGFITVVNPDIIGDVYVNLGPVTGYGGKRAPAYRRVPGVPLQVQACSYGALQRADSLNIQGVKRQVYLNGVLRGVERLAGAGGDILGFAIPEYPSGAYWLVVDVLEAWDADGWVKVLVQLQVTTPENVTS